MLNLTKSSLVAMSMAVLMSLMGSSAGLEACTGIKLTAKDGSIVHGRTLEFGIKVDASAAIIPRGYKFTGTTPQGPGLSYASKYAAVGALTFGYPAIMDGINEKGLSAGAFYFPGFASYAKLTKENQSKAVAPTEFVNWIVTQFATVEEVKAALPNIVIAPTVVKEWGNIVPPFHYIVYDKSGKSLVIEPINGQLLAYDNPIGVVTNSPTFDWHSSNLRNYINLTPNNVNPLRIEGLVLAPFGQGSGMVGMPGDFTPPSRFVRAAIFSTTAIPSETADNAIFQGFHILNQFDIPVGVARQDQGGVVHTDYTLITVVRDPQSLKYYFKTYEDQTIRSVDLNKFDLNAKDIKSVSVNEYKQTAVDVSKDLQ